MTIFNSYVKLPEGNVYQCVSMVNDEEASNGMMWMRSTRPLQAQSGANPLDPKPS